MKNFAPTLLFSLSALALSGCQAPATPGTDTTDPNTNNTPPASTVPQNKPTRTLNPVTCSDQSVKIDLTHDSIFQQGTVKGYNYCEYQIELKAGQHLNVEFNSPAIDANVIVYDRVDIGITQLTQEGYTATKNETLPVRVLLTRNEARTGKQHPFSVKFTAK